MERSTVNPASLKKTVRPRSSFLSWIFNSTSATSTEKNDNEEAEKVSNKLEVRERDLMNTSYSTPTATGSYTHLRNADTNKPSGDVEIPNRRQSHLYTPFHNNIDQGTTPVVDNIYNKRRSYYTSSLSPLDANISSASLTRSATWQPSTSASPNTQTPNVDIIPDRRTSRNYANNPEIQARLDAMLNSDKTSYLATVLHNGAPPSTNTNVNRRSTTPANRTS
jgi:hypothetical protein